MEMLYAVQCVSKRGYSLLKVEDLLGLKGAKSQSAAAKEAFWRKIADVGAKSDDQVDSHRTLVTMVI